MEAAGRWPCRFFCLDANRPFSIPSIPPIVINTMKEILTFIDSIQLQLVK